MTYTPGHALVDLLDRPQQLRAEAESYRRARVGRNGRKADRRLRRAIARAVTTLGGRIRRSLDSLTEWPRPV
ncbi:MAG TPA: hypothetical protein VFZ63_08660 [Jiangellaceae bacterium]